MLLSTHRRPLKQQGFTLVELSIVLVIIGLLIGGVLVGRDLIYNARIKKVINELQQYQIAFNAFREKYDCIAGDCINATNFLGTDSNGCPSGGGTAGVCNGNGNGLIETCFTGEALNAWRHLAKSNFITGNFLGSGGCASLVINNNIPGSAYASSIGFNLTTPNVGIGYPGATASWNVVIQLGAVSTTVFDQLWGAGLIAPDAQALDRKMDDGTAAGGIMYSTNSYYPSAANSNTTCLTAGNYSSSTTTGCTVYWKIY